MITSTQQRLHNIGENYRGNALYLNYKEGDVLRQFQEIEAQGFYRGINEGDFVMKKFRDGTLAYLYVKKIKYEDDPTDMFDCVLIHLGTTKNLLTNENIDELNRIYKSINNPQGGGS